MQRVGEVSLSKGKLISISIPDDELIDAARIDGASEFFICSQL